jgi:hypothetical protein
MIVNLSLVAAFRKLKQAFNATRQRHRDAMRPLPESVVELYHRAVWAIDLLGPAGDADRFALWQIWRDASHVAANASGAEGGMIAEDIIRTLKDESEKVLRAIEKDGQREIWEKQRDFLVGTLRRVRRTMQLNDVTHLHYYKKHDAVFSVDLHHPDFQVGYDLWQGVVTELKAAITFVIYSPKPLHLKVEYIVGQMRKLIMALESADLSGLMYEKSPLHLSKEEEGRMLWEAVREHAAKVIAQSEARIS